MITRWCSSYRLRSPLRISMVSSTVGGSTITVWKRRSSAPSFSMYLRYSLSVDAPTHCSSPRASAGFSILDASTAPSAAPQRRLQHYGRLHGPLRRPRTPLGVQLIDEQDDNSVLRGLGDYRLEPL